MEGDAVVAAAHHHHLLGLGGLREDGGLPRHLSHNNQVIHPDTFNKIHSYRLIHADVHPVTFKRNFSFTIPRSPFEESVVVREAGREVANSGFTLKSQKNYKTPKNVQVGSLLVSTPVTQYTQCRLDESQVVSRCPR